MTCPNCKTGESKVLDSRPNRNKIRRRRECLSCQQRFTTVEHVVCDPDFDVMARVMQRLESIQDEVTAAVKTAREIQAGIGG